MDGNLELRKPIFNYIELLLIKNIHVPVPWSLANPRVALPAEMTAI